LESTIVKKSPYIKEVGVFMEEGILQALIYPEMNQVRAKSIEELPQLIQQAVLDFNNEISPYKRIKRFHIIAEELPKTRLGKIQRFKLKYLVSGNIIQKQSDDSKTYSEEYILLKSFIDKETGYRAGENDHFEIHLAMDSLTRVSLLAFVENTFGLHLSEDDLNQLNTLSKLSQHIIDSKATLQHGKSVSWKEILSAKKAAFPIPKSGITHKSLNNLSKIVFNVLYRSVAKASKHTPRTLHSRSKSSSALDGLFITSMMKRNSTQDLFLCKRKTLAKQHHAVYGSEKQRYINGYKTKTCAKPCKSFLMCCKK
jgi:long-chain acyl-CoA synthetase